MKQLVAVLLCLGLVGCATTPSLNKISIGMSKQDVVNQLGTPQSTSAKGNVEYLEYLGPDPAGHDWAEDAVTIHYFVRLVNGIVESYGKVGDFNTYINTSKN